MENYQPKLIPILTTITPADFAINAARNVLGGICFKQGMGCMYYSRKAGCWQEDHDDKKTRGYLFKLAHRYRETWRDKARHSGVLKMCRLLESPRFILGEIEPPIKSFLYRESSLFDADRYTINCQGIAVDLRTGRMRCAVSKDYFTKSTGFKPGNPDDAVRFRQFLLEVCGGDADKAAWVLRRFYRAAAGINLDSIILNLEGSGCNGKSVIQNLFLRGYGSYGTVLPQELVIKGEGSSEAARAFHGLEGVRYGTLADCGRGTLRLSELKKESAEGTRCRAGALRQERVTFESCVSLVIGSNMPLRLTETGEAIQRRLKNVKFEWKGKPDRLLPGKLLAAGEAVTGLIIKECAAYLADIKAGGTGFPPREAIEQYAREHIEAQNPIMQFLLERPEMGAGKMPCKMVWEAYQGFYKDTEGCFPKRHDFNAGMEREGFRVVQGTSARHWKKAHKAG